MDASRTFRDILLAASLILISHSVSAADAAGSAAVGRHADSSIDHESEDTIAAWDSYARRRSEDRNARLKYWRKALQIGDKTFCGSIVKLKPPLVKIELNDARKVWLQIIEVYPDWMVECRIVNGRPLPRINLPW